MTIAQASDRLVGRSLGEFVICERIGEGGWGAVYRATQPTLEREAVVKVLLAELDASAAATERFLREAKLASKLDHPYAAHIYAFGAEPDGELWIAMELVRGTPLDQILKARGPLALERLVPLLDRICEVVHTAHEQGIVHRDLKPANVMVLARAGRLLPKLLDFGIAKGLADEVAAEPSAEPSDDEDLDLTQRGAIVGSPPYMAPEQWVDAGHVGARTDLYALGILAYECLTGAPPFTGATITQFVTAHANDPPPPLGPRFPAALDAVFAKILAKDPDDRYPNALAFAAAFREASGFSQEAVALPALDPAVRDAALARAPQPIAEAVAALDAARNAYQARDAIVQLARTITRFLALLALACRSRVTSGDEPAAIAETLRTLYRRALSDLEWIELARVLAQAWQHRRDAYPVPELVDLFDDDTVTTELAALVALADTGTRTAEAVADAVEEAVERVGRVLERVAFLGEYALVVTESGGVAQRWTGVRRTQRTTTRTRGRDLPAGVPALLDKDGAPVLSLAPVFQIVAPTPGAPVELFLFDGRDARGARLVALPAGFEHHDDELWDWFRAQLAGSLDETDATSGDEKPPYRGLQPFTVEDNASFFGRERQVDAFVNRLQVQPLLAVVGRSGAGKSSFVHAGVVPAFGWRAITLRPGPSPMAALVARLETAGIGTMPALGASLAADRDLLGSLLRADADVRGPVVLVVDQLEEMFTLCQDDRERRAFAEALAVAARSAEDPVRVIFTLRDDFLVRTEEIPALRNRIGQGLQLVTVPGVDELRRIVVEPARRAGYELEADLAEEMVHEVADQPGALPLLSFTAAQLWELRDRHFKQLTRSAYKMLGGVGGALARHADITLDAMPPDEHALAREAFRQLVTTQDTRAVLLRRDLRQLLGDADAADRVLEKLVAARLLVASENERGVETLEIVHEALLVAWPRLVRWRREDAEGARFREQLRAAAEQWHERGRTKGLLWRGDALADFTRWRARHAGPLTELEAAFATASVADAARGRLVRRVLVASAFAVLVAVLAVLAVANTRITAQKHELRENLQKQYEAQGRQNVLDGKPLVALAYLEKAAELGASGRAHDFVVAEAIRASDGELFEVRHDLPVWHAEFSHDGALLVTAGYDHRAKISDARTGKLVAELVHGDNVVNAAFSPDDSTVLTGSTDGTAVVWDAHTGHRLQTLHHTGRLRCALFSHDGALAITAADGDPVAIWDVHRGTRVALPGDAASYVDCALSPDGRLLAAGDRRGVVRVWNLRTRQLDDELSGPTDLGDVRFVPHSDLVVAASSDGPVATWSLATGQLVYRLEGRFDWVDASRDGRYLVTASADGAATIWDAATGQRERVLAGHTAAVLSATLSPDGRYVVTASQDKTVWLWEAATGRVLARWHGHRGTVQWAGFDASGERVVSISEGGEAIVWSVHPQERIVWLTGHANAVISAMFTRDGKTVVTAGLDGTVRVWDAATGREQAALHDHDGGVWFAAVRPDGEQIATGGDDGKVRIWDVATKTIVATWPASPNVSQVAWSPDGKLVAADGDDRALYCWDAATGALRFANRQTHLLNAVAFDGAGTHILTAGNAPDIDLWNLDGTKAATYRDPDNDSAHWSAELSPDGTRLLAASGRQLALIFDRDGAAAPIRLRGHNGLVADASWSPDGELAITASLDGTAGIWDTHTGALLALYRHPPEVRFATFSPDGKRIVIAGSDGTVAIHDLPTAEPAEVEHVIACRLRERLVGDALVPVTPDDARCGR